MSLARVRAADKTIPSIPVKGSLRDEMLLFLSERCIEIGGAELTADVLDFLDDLEASPEAETPEVETLSRRVAVAARKMIRKEEMSDGILSRLEDFLEKRTTGLLSKITGHADEALLQEIVSSFASLSLDQDNYEDARSLLQKRLVPSILSLPEVSRVVVFPAFTRALKQSWLLRASSFDEISDIIGAVLELVFACADVFEWPIAAQCITSLLSNSNGDLSQLMSVQQVLKVLQELLSYLQEHEERGVSYNLAFITRVLVPAMETCRAVGHDFGETMLAPMWTRTLKIAALTFQRAFPSILGLPSSTLNAGSFTGCQECNERKLMEIKRLHQVSAKQTEDLRRWLSHSHKIKSIFLLIADPHIREKLLGLYSSKLKYTMLWDTAPQHVHQHGLIRFPNPNSTPANVLPSDKRTTSSQHSLVFQPSQPSPSLSAEGTGQIVGHHTGSSSGTETAAYDDNVAPLFTNSSSLQRSGPGTVTFTKDTMQGDDSMSNTDIHSRKRHLPDLRSDDPVDGQKRYRTGPGSSYNTVQSPMPITPYTFSPAFLDSISHNSTRPSSSNSTPTGAQASDSSTGLTQVGLRAESTDIHERLSTIVESPEASKPLDLKVLTNETESPNVSDHPAEKSLQPEEHNEHYVLEAQVPQTVPPTSSLHLKNPTGKANSDAHQLQQSANITSKVSRLPIASTRKTSTGHLTPRVRSPEMRPNSPPVRNMKSPVTSPSAASRMRSPSPGLPPWNPGPY